MDRNKIIAHITNNNKTQPLIEHLINVGDKAGEFAKEFGEEKLARTIGIYHDIGKATVECQNRLWNHGAGNIVDHSTPSAKFVINETNNNNIISNINADNNNIISSMCIMSHHTGLVNGGSLNEEGSYKKRINKATCKIVDNLGLTNIIDNQFAQINNTRDFFYIHLRLKMLFSCLVDADFLDTENFMSEGKVHRDGFDSISLLKYKMDNYLIRQGRFNPSSAFNAKRTALLRNCIETGDTTEEGLLSLTMPTGSGKTESSLALALHLAERKNRSRIIYVIPYTSIIQQNAEVFRNILGEKNVVEHHSNVEFNDNKGKTDIRKLATENWDAPIIVTTNVQFFESLYGNKTSKCRKLHNIVNSVIIFDEAQMLPVEYLTSCMSMVAELVKNYNCTAILCTATQPSLGRFFTPHGMKITEISKNPIQDYLDFKRTNIFFNHNAMTKKELALELSKKKKVLCICNTIKDTKQLYDLVQSSNKYCLTTHLFPKHREKMIEDIKSDMYDKDECIVIATSLVEAGVNLDFPYVYREKNGIDNIIQSAGRCNRENKFNSGHVVVFKLKDGIKGIMKKNVNSTNAVVSKVASGKISAIDSPDGIKEYFNNLYSLQGTTDHKNIYKDICNGKKTYSYKDVANDFKIINNTTHLILIPINQEAKDLLTEIQNSTGKFIDRDLIRSAMKYAVNLRYNDDDTSTRIKPFESLNNKGVLTAITEDLYFLNDLSQYDKEKGIIV